MQKITFENEKGQRVEFKNSRPFILTDIEGVGGVETSLITTKSPYQDGTTHHNTLLNERILVIKGGIMGLDKEDMFKKRQELSSIFSPKMKGRLTYKNDALERSIDCVVELGPTWGKKVRRMQEFMIQLYCPNPFWLDKYEIGEEIAQWLGGFKFPLRLPTKFATKGEPRALLINQGDVETPVKIIITGPATNPMIRNQTTDEYIKVNRILGQGEQLHISTEFGKKRVYIKDNEGIETNVLNWIDLNSTFFNLKAGDNAIDYTSDDDVIRSRVFISFYNRYVGA